MQRFRDNVFLPANLLAAQRKLVYGRKNWNLLTNPDEPATARIGDEVVRMVPLDKTKDEPNLRKSYLKALQIMREQDDWRNLPIFLEGLNSARRLPANDYIEKSVRWMVEAGRRGEVLGLFKRTQSTGIGLWDAGVAREVMWGAPSRCALSEWTKESILAAVSYAEEAWGLLHDPRHEGPTMPEGHIHPGKSPEIAAVMLQMHAAKALVSGKDPESLIQVEKYAAKMFLGWNHLDLSLDDEEAWTAINYKMCVWAPIWHSLKLARTVLGDKNGMYNGLKTEEAALYQVLEKAEKALAEHPSSQKSVRRGPNIYHAFSKFAA